MPQRADQLRSLGGITVSHNEIVAFRRLSRGESPLNHTKSDTLTWQPCFRAPTVLGAVNVARHAGAHASKRPDRVRGVEQAITWRPHPGFPAVSRPELSCRVELSLGSYS